MDWSRRRRNDKTLLALIVIGVAYSSLFYFQPALTPANRVDGIIGVLLGLYICSHPAANGIDLLFFGQPMRRPFSSRIAVVLWIMLNAVALGVGWFVIFIGTTRLIGRGSQ